jgi:hypothetical protein
MRSNNDVTNCFARRALRTDMPPRIPTFDLGLRNESRVGSLAEKYAYRQVRVKQMRDARKYVGHARAENPGQETRFDAPTCLIAVSIWGISSMMDLAGIVDGDGYFVLAVRENEGRVCRNEWM